MNRNLLGVGHGSFEEWRNFARPSKRRIIFSKSDIYDAKGRVQLPYISQV